MTVRLVVTSLHSPRKSVRAFPFLVNDAVKSEPEA